MHGLKKAPPPSVPKPASSEAILSQECRLKCPVIAVRIAYMPMHECCSPLACRWMSTFPAQVLMHGGCSPQGDQPHCGFPEAKYLDCVERLVRHGLRVVVVEQTETPEMLKQRNDSRAAGTKKVSRD